MGKDIPAHFDARDFMDENAGGTAIYVPLNVPNAIVEAKTKCDKLVNDLMKLYISDELVKEHQFINTLKQFESDTLVNLYKKVVYSNHIVDTIMMQIDSVGYNINTFHSLMNIQQQAIAVTMDFTRYLRQVPGLFKSIKLELQQLAAADANSKEISAEFDSAEYMVKPIRGHADLLEELNKYISDVKENYESIDVTKYEPMPQELIEQGESEQFNDFEIALEKAKKSKDANK